MISIEEVLEGAEGKAADIRAQLATYAARGLKVFTTSSFQTHSIPLLHILSTLQFDVPVVFLNTGYLFPQTLEFRDTVAQQLGLRVVDLRPNVPKSDQRTPDGRLMFAADPDKCCYFNKVEPLEPYLRSFDVWISGVRAEQSATRKAFSVEQPGTHGVTRYHPMLDWSAREIFAYRKAHRLPEHPLDAQGFQSIGCMPCTINLAAEEGGRGGRWAGLSKTECGLHTELAEVKKEVP